MNGLPDEEENAAELQFGNEFEGENVQCLTNDEVYFLLLQRNTGTAQSTDTYKQTLEYVGQVATTSIQVDLRSLARELAEQLKSLELERRSDRKLVNLHPFEIASLANLIKSDDTSVEETLSWIPSLSRFDEDQVMRAVEVVVEAKMKIDSSRI